MHLYIPWELVTGVTGVVVGAIAVILLMYILVKRQNIE